MNLAITQHIQNLWEKFKDLIDEPLDNHILKNGFRFVILYVIFKIIMIENVKRRKNTSNFSEKLNLLDYFNEQLCYSILNCTSEENLLTFSLSTDLSDIRVKIPDKIITYTQQELSKLDFFEDKEILSDIYSDTLDGIERKLQGIYYTPKGVVNILIKNSIDLYLQNNQLDELTILEPSCGTGNFLLACFYYIKENFIKMGNFEEDSAKFTFKIIKDHLFAYDTDLFALIICKLRLLIEIITLCPEFTFENDELRELFHNIKFNDFLKIDLDFKPSLVVGNPPWGAIKNNFYKKEIINKYQLQKGQVDRYRLFLEASIKTNPIIISLITPDSWLEIPGAKKLKDFILETWVFRTIYLIPETTFNIKTHFIGFIASKKEYINEKQHNIEVIRLNNNFQIDYESITQINENYFEMNKSLRIIGLNENLQIIKEDLERDKNHYSLGSIIDCTIGYQLYHHSIHTKSEIEGKIYHSDKKIDSNWIEEINSKDLKFLSLDFSNKHYVKKTAVFFRIPPMKFFESNKILLREILSKNGFVLAMTDKPLFFTKTIISIILKDFQDENTLYTILGYLMSYVCLFDLFIHGVKSSKKYFPRVSINSLKALHFSSKLFHCNLEFLIRDILEIEIYSEVFYEKLYLLQAKIFLSYNFDVNKAKILMEYLEVSHDKQQHIFDFMRSIQN